MLIDNHTFFRKSLRSFLEETGEIEVIGEAQDGQKALELILALPPQLVIMDIQMSGRSGLEMCKIIKQMFPLVRVILYSMYEMDIYHRK